MLTISLIIIFMYHFTFIPGIVNKGYNYILFIFFNYEQK